ncbi:hypothetical protein ALC62_02268 [Cyphomyrmex costatus]|uniref:Myb/SANT-like DNA-binding domain-containing protein n=1 Tax=Cyphomyrmex costatus TaxID=456900 RepID=A0A151IN61_9HYME|nr:hypothetical protein ALC62_02268 [Cyphomyrmex costatus]
MLIGILYCIFLGSFYRWTTSCVLLLLQTYKENEEKFTNGKQSQKKTWEKISKILKCKGHITRPMCAAKLKSLKKTYKSVKDHNNKSGNDRKSWQFFEIMDEIFSKKAWCAPVAIASSSGLSKTHEKEIILNLIVNVQLPSRSKQNMSTLLAKRLRQKEEHEEAKKKRHKDRMEMDEKFLSVLEKLANK